MISYFAEFLPNTWRQTLSRDPQPCSLDIIVAAFSDLRGRPLRTLTLLRPEWPYHNVICSSTALEVKLLLTGVENEATQITQPHSTWLHVIRNDRIIDQLRLYNNTFVPITTSSIALLGVR